MGLVSQITAALYHSCAIKTDGTAACWGDSTYGNTTVPPGVGTVTQISALGYHTCAIRTDGTPVCWGSNSHGQSTIPPGIGTVTQISAGLNHTCAVKTGGAIVCWGADNAGQLGTAPATTSGPGPATTSPPPDTTGPVIVIPSRIKTLAARSGVVLLRYGAALEDTTGVIALKSGGALGSARFTAAKGRVIVVRIKLEREGQEDAREAPQAQGPGHDHRARRCRQRDDEGPKFTLVKAK